MAIDPTKIEMTPQQKELLATRAKREGKDYSAVLDDLLGSSDSIGIDAPSGTAPESMREAMEAVGAAGCVDGPGDLTTNPKHMEGFGLNANSRSDSD